MKTKLFALLLVLFCSCSKSEKKSPAAEKGVLDLRDWDFEKDGVAKLDGQWEFYWKKLYTSPDFSDTSVQQKAMYAAVPGFWKNMVIDSEKLSGRGYATYRLRVKLNRSYPALGINMLDAGTSYKLWINNKYVASNGTVSANADEMKPQFLSQVSVFNPDSSQIELIFQVANNLIDKGGLWSSIRVGMPGQVFKEREGEIMATVFFAGTLFILFIYNIWIFFLRRTEKAALWFALVCFSFMIRTMIVNERVLYLLLPNFPFGLGYRLEYLSIFPWPMLFTLYFNTLFPGAISKKFLNFFIGAAIVETAVFLFTPHSFYSANLYAYQALLLVYCGYMFSITFHRRFRHEYEIRLMQFGWVILISAAVNDILHTLLIINTIYVAEYAFFIFMLINAYNLAHKIDTAIRTVEDLSTNLEHKVEERTMELAIEKRRAEQSERYKQQFLANMSHEIRTPMNAVMGMTNLLIEKKPRDDQFTYLDGIKKSSDNLLHIINDILDMSKIEVGKMELEKIDFSIRDVVQQVKQTLEHKADEKGLQLIADIDPQIPDVRIGDPTRLNQVLMNLAGNAIKFTEKGSVTIELKPSDKENNIRFAVIEGNKICSQELTNKKHGNLRHGNNHELVLS